MTALKVIELVGVSTESWGAAARAAVAEASRTVRHIEHLEVLKSTAVVREGEIVEYQAHVKLTFRVEDAREPLEALVEAETILTESTAGDGEPEPVLKPPEGLLDEREGLGDAQPRP